MPFWWWVGVCEVIWSVGGDEIGGGEVGEVGRGGGEVG